MKAQKICPCCGAISYENIEEQIRFIHDGNIIQATATRENDAFYEITKGKYKGCSVHIFDILK